MAQWLTTTIYQRTITTTKSVLERAFDCIPQGVIICGEFLTSGTKNVIARVPFFTDEKGIHYVELQGDRVGDLLVHGNRGHWRITTVPSGTLVLDSHILSFEINPVTKSDVVAIAKMISISGLYMPTSLNDYLLGAHLRCGDFAAKIRGIIEEYAIQNNKAAS